MGRPAPGAACQHVGSVPFDKTKFVLHAGLAFGAFHRFIYAPYKANTRRGVGVLVNAVRGVAQMVDAG